MEQRKETRQVIWETNISKFAACLNGTWASMIEEFGDDMKIPINSNVMSLGTLQKIIEFCEYRELHPDGGPMYKPSPDRDFRLDQWAEWDADFLSIKRPKLPEGKCTRDQVCEILKAAHFLDNERLIDSASRAIATSLHDIPIDELRSLIPEVTNEKDASERERKCEILQKQFVDFQDRKREQYEKLRQQRELEKQQHSTSQEPSVPLPKSITIQFFAAPEN